MTIAITGATGQLGRLAIKSLKQKVAADAIIALARTPESAADLGVAVRAADYDQPATLGAALDGVETLLLISGNQIGQRARQHAAVIAAAKEAGVARIVYTSLLRADASPLNLAPEHAQTESAIRQSGLAFTILRNGWYTENYTGSAAAALASGVLYGSAGDGRIASAPRADYAQAAVEALTGPNHIGKTYELAGDQSYSLSELAAEIGRQGGKAVRYQDLPEAEYAAALLKAGLPGDFAAAIASWDAAAAKGGLFDDGRQLSALIGRPTTPLAAVLADALKS